MKDNTSPPSNPQPPGAPALSGFTLRFYAELNDFLPHALRQRAFSVHTPRHHTIKHLIESCGVPHTEVELILVNSVPVDFTCIPKEGDRISVYPAFEAFDISPLTRLRPEPLRQIRFIADTHMGKLAVYLRMLGFDTLYRRDFRDDEIARIASQEQRIVLTRDRGLLKRSLVTHGLYVHSTQPRQQVKEVLQRLQLAALIKPFQRCMACNGLLAAVDKQAVLSMLPPDTQKYYDAFRQCPDCRRIYWKGSHYQKMMQFIEEVAA